MPDGNNGLSPTFYQQLLETAPDGVVVVDGMGTIRLVNRQAEVLFGWDRSDLIGRPVEMLVPLSARPSHPSHRGGFFAHPATRPMGGGVNLTALRSDGSELAVDISLSPVEMSGEVWVSAAVRDATKRQQAERELVRANERLMATVAEMERQGRELALVNDMGDILQSCLSSEEAYMVVAHFAARLFPEETGALFVPGEDHTIFTKAVGWDTSGTTWVQSFSSEDCWALRRGRAHRSQDGIPCYHTLDPPTGEGWTMCLPLMAQGVVLGLLHLCGEGAPVRSKGSLERVATTVAEHLGLALANLRLRETLHARSIHDGLTGVFNRAHLDESVDQAVQSAAASGTPVAVLEVDIDHFKELNDAQGHRAGDDVLRRLAGVLLQSVRPGDSVFRQGGDEFLVVLPGSNASVALQRAEHVLRAWSAVEPESTVSVGVAAFPDQAKTATELLDAADKALYEAKRAGRNLIRAAPVDEPRVTTSSPGRTGADVFAYE